MPSPRSKRLLPTDPARAALMRSVRREHTAPEMMVRRWLHAAGLRFRLHVRSLPGTPDLVLPARETALFVHGCFWHGHCCRRGRIPARTNAAYWSTKIAENRRRDARKRNALRRLGWKVEVIWECWTRDPARLEALAERLLRR